MASGWIAGMISNGVQTAIQPGIASAGSFAGGAVSSVGNGVNGVGESINGYVRRYGTGIQEYGNAIRDWTGAEGPRAQTAANPLGLSSNKAGGKLGVTNPRLPAAVSRSYSSPPAPSTKKIEAGGKKPGQKAIDGPGKKSPLAGKVSGTSTARNAAGVGGGAKVSTKSGGGNSGPAKGQANGKVKVSAASKPSSLGKAAPMKPAAGLKKPAAAPALPKGKGGMTHLYIGGD